MTTDQQIESRLKKLLRSVYRIVVGFHVFLTAPIKPNTNPLIYYAGARSGDVGGPLVKVARLQRFFPNSPYLYNIVYALSNTPYLPQASLDWLRICNIPIVLNQNGVFYPAWSPRDWRQQNHIMSLAYHKADYVFWQSEFCRRCADRFLGIRSKPGEVLFNAVDTSYFSPCSIKTSRPFTFLLTGKISKHLEYRLSSSIDGLAIARKSGLDARLLVAGWLENPSRLVEIASNSGVLDHVIYTGPYSQSEAPRIYNSADAYVMTKYMDPCPNTVLEAMSCGLPILYSARGGVPELVGHDAGIGLLVKEDWDHIHVPSAEAIAKGMITISERSSDMSLASRERAVNEFDIARWISRHRQIFSSVLSIA